jgi:competence protein ComEC
MSLAAFCAGLLIASRASSAHPALWAGVGAIGAALPLIWRGRTAVLGLLVGMLGLGATVWSVRMGPPGADDLARSLPAGAGEPAVLIDVEGQALGPAEPVVPQRGALAEHLPDRLGPRVRVDVALELVHTDTGPRRATGRAIVWADPPAPALRAGDRVRLMGLARASHPARNPGEPARRGGAVWIDAGAGGRVAVVDHPDQRSALLGALRRWLDAPRVTARRIIDRALPAEGDAGALVRGLILGEREDEGLSGAFRRVGLSHLLSVSGFHLTVMAGVALLAVRAGGDRGWLEPALVAGALGIYMLIVPAQAPVLRAGFTLAALLVGEALGRRHDRLALLAWIAVAVLIVRPADLFSPGFQLSFGLVAWLLVLAEPRPDAIELDPFEDRATRPLWRETAAFFRDGAAATAACWSVSIPLVMHHAGVITPLAIPATLIAVPLVVATMWLGFGLLLAGTVAPALAGPFGAVLAAPAGWCAAAVRWFDALPGATVHTPPVSLAWTAAATAGIGYLWRRGRLRDPRFWLIPAALGAWLAAEAWHGRGVPDRTAARVVMLDVGDGSALLVQRGRDALLWDCGSSRPSIGVRTVPDACRALGAARVRTAVVTHANLDHYVGLLDAAPVLGLRTLVTGESFARAAGADPAGPEAALLRGLARLGVAHRVVAAGDSIELGGARLDILHPPRGFIPRAENDASLVARLDHNGASMLLTGDAQAEALAMLMASGVDLRAAVLELPHHGSAHETAYAFARAVSPAVVLQSTGPSRLDDARWDALRQGRLWLVTARDGAVEARFGDDGSLRAGPVR